MKQGGFAVCEIPSLELRQTMPLQIFLTAKCGLEVQSFRAGAIANGWLSCKEAQLDVLCSSTAERGFGKVVPTESHTEPARASTLGSEERKLRAGDKGVLANTLMRSSIDNPRGREPMSDS